MCRKTPRGQKGRQCQDIRSPDNHPITLCSGILFGQNMFMHFGHFGEGPESSRVWEVKQDNWLKDKKKRPGRTAPYKWFRSPLHHAPQWGGCPHSHSSFGCVLLFCFCLRQLDCSSVCSPTCCTVFLIINFVLIFTVCSSLKHFLFQQWARIRAILLLASSWSSG